MPAREQVLEPFSRITFDLGGSHPVYDVLGKDLTNVQEDPYAWYVRVAHLPDFMRLIAPALEQRLAHSVAAGYSGELTLDFYRSGLRMVFERGKVTNGGRLAEPNLECSAERALSSPDLFADAVWLSQPGRALCRFSRCAGERPPEGNTSACFVSYQSLLGNRLTQPPKNLPVALYKRATGRPEKKRRTCLRWLALLDCDGQPFLLSQQIHTSIHNLFFRQHALATDCRGNGCDDADDGGHIKGHAHAVHKGR